MFQASFEGIISLTAVSLSWALAVVLFRVGAPDSVARKLSLLLFFEGLTLGSSDSLLALLESPETFAEQYPGFWFFQHILHTLGDCGMVALYPPFLAAALRTKWTRPFAGKRGRNISLAMGIILFVVTLSGNMVESITTVTISLLYVSMAALFLYAFVVSVQAWHVAEGVARQRALIFTLAFGFRDICWNIVYLMAMWGTWVNWEFMELGNMSKLFLLYPLGTLISVPLIAYGILRTQLFDIDLKIRWTIKQSTFAAAVVGITFVVSEGVEMLVAAEMGDKWGLVAAAVALLFLKPLQTLAERFVSFLMPNTQNTAEYKRSRKIHVYEEAVSEAHLEGGISDKERSLLVRLRQSLEISEDDAVKIEHQIVSGLAPAS